jgi:anti-anti-sigma regulatory factor
MALFDQTSPPSMHQGNAPMLKISIASQSREETVLKVEGWVSDSGVAVLERELVNHLQQAKQLLLDFTGVMTVDANGIDMLRRNRKQLRLRAGSAFIRALLSMNGLQPEN